MVIELISKLISGPLGDIIQTAVYIASIVIDAVSSILSAITPAVTTITSTLFPLISAGVQWLLGIINSGLTIVIGLIELFTNAWKVASEKVHTWVHNIATTISTVFQSIPATIRSAINSVIYWIESGINNIINKINNSGVVSALNRFTGANIYLNPIYIPRLAKGGVVTTPTIAQVGEYSGAHSNPEIITPESLLKETIDASNSELAGVFAQVGQQIIAAINNKDLDVQIGDTIIAKSAARGNRQYQLATGQSLF